MEFFNSGKLGEFLIYSGNFWKCGRGHRVLCILSVTVTVAWIDWVAQ